MSDIATLRASYTEADHGFTTLCWDWQGPLHNEGYAIRYQGNSQVRMHREFYEQVRGPVPTGLELDHLCRNRRCVNPDHLEAVTHAENIRRGAKTKLRHDDVAAIRASTEPSDIVGDRYGVTRRHINDIRAGRRWAA